MECITLANDIISMYSTNLVIGLILFTGLGVCLGICVAKFQYGEKVLF
jgi:hypothetical protein